MTNPPKQQEEAWGDSTADTLGILARANQSLKGNQPPTIGLLGLASLTLDRVE